MLGVVITAAAGILPIAISASCGALVMILTGCLTWRDATRALSVQVIMIVAASLALGAAMLKTGAADYLARCFLAVMGEANPRLILAGLMLLLAILTNVVSNNAAAVIGTPIGISIARQLGSEPRTFRPRCPLRREHELYHSHGLQDQPADHERRGYRFSDFVRVGTPLTVIALLAFSWILPLFYSL
ncbi:MAG: SLC13 family permease [Desulfobacterales bacterium]|nr:SLC13 family permease [Desulfobacterales bacterium]